MKTLQAVLLTAVLAGSAWAGEPKHLFIDPASRWISMHDTTGSGARAELSRSLIKSCPDVILTDRREAAQYSVLIDRTGISSGSVLIYTDDTVIHSFKPGHIATLRKVAETVCDYVGAQ